MDAAEPAGDLRQLDNLVGRRKRARHVKETRAETERPVLHSLLDEPAHLLQLVVFRSAIDFADHLGPNRALADERPDVDGRVQRLELRQKRSDWDRGRAVRSGDERRHSLPDIVIGRRDLEDAAGRVRMDVDESGRHDLLADVDGS